MTNPKIFVFDLDGTLVFDGVTLAEPIKQALLALNQSAKIIFASARPIRDMLPLLDDFASNDLIGGNGSIIRQNGQILTTKTLETSVVKRISDFVNENQLDFVLDYDWNFTARVAPDNGILNKLNVRQLAKNVPLQFDKVIKAIIFGVSPEQAANLHFPEPLEILYHADARELVITAAGIDKCHVLRQLIGAQPYTAFGNDKNDLRLL